jgi:F-type H+-transporting ATPase subunit gamma
VYLIFNQFITTIHQQTITRRLLPLDPKSFEPTISTKKQVPGTIIDPVPILEPNSPIFLEQAASLLLEYSIRSAYIHSQLSEHAARMTAMENANNNTRELINRYAQLRNRARQSTITGELIEIISGKEALKG